MRVCVVTTSYPRYPGDVSETTSGAIVRHLVARTGVEVTVLAPGEAGAPPRGESPGLEVRRIRYFWPARLQKLAYGAGIPWNLRRSVLAWLNLPTFFLAFAWAIWRHARRADLVHAHWGGLGALAVALRPLHRRPVVVTILGSDWRTRLAPVRWLSGWAVRHADAVTTPCQDFAASFRAMRGDAQNVWFLPIGVDAPPAAEIERRRAASAATPGPHVASVGRLVPERRHDNLIRALARVRERFPTAHLTIIGDGPQRQHLDALVHELGLAGAVTLTGLAPRHALLADLVSADIYVSPTSIDAFGTATVEAAAYGLPIITTRVGFPAELVADGVTGYVIPPEDVGALVEALVKMCDLGPEGRRAMGRRMRQRFDALDLTWPSVTERLVAIYQACMGGKPR
jgi:glycosyltransferase involved in cell wall biosynthesis